MLRFLSPFWLISLLAVAVPVAIHVLSRKAGKKIKVGSIRFLEASASHRLKSLKLSEIPLLLLRAALVAILALLLAQPYWQEKPKLGEANPRGWVLVAPELLSNLPRSHQHLIDSLVAAGNELHLLAPEFPHGMNPRPRIGSRLKAARQAALAVLHISRWFTIGRSNRCCAKRMRHYLLMLLCGFSLPIV
jgi:hypothetical protein